MIKKFTDKDYAEKAIKANSLNQKLYIYTHNEEVEIDVPDFETVEETQTVVELDDEGTPHEKEITVEVQKPVIDKETGEPITHKETVTEQVAELLIGDVNYYVCYQDNYTDGTINENYEEEKAQAERERRDMLKLSKREVFLALYKDKGITPEQLRAQIQSVEAQIEFDYANDYYRGNPLINSIGALLGYTPEQIDNLFVYKTFNPPETTEEQE